MSNANLPICMHAGEIAAYLDGELEAAIERAFETHLPGCADCAEKLNLQKRLLCALDAAFTDEKKIELPINFARSVAVRAEANVSGLRSQTERRRALLIAAGLLSVGFLIGIASRQNGLTAILTDKFLAQIFVVFKVLTDFCRDFGFGLGVIWRVIERQMTNELRSLESFFAVLFVVSFLLLSGILLKFHRFGQSGLNNLSEK